MRNFSIYAAGICASGHMSVASALTSPSPRSTQRVFPRQEEDALVIHYQRKVYPRGKPLGLQYVWRLNFFHS